MYVRECVLAQMHVEEKGGEKRRKGRGGKGEGKGKKGKEEKEREGLGSRARAMSFLPPFRPLRGHRPQGIYAAAYSTAKAVCRSVCDVITSAVARKGLLELLLPSLP